METYETPLDPPLRTESCTAVYSNLQHDGKSRVRLERSEVSLLASRNATVKENADDDA